MIFGDRCQSEKYTIVHCGFCSYGALETPATGKTAWATKSSFLCTPRRFLVPEHAGWKAGGRQDCLPHKAENPTHHKTSLREAAQVTSARWHRLCCGPFPARQIGRASCRERR